MCSSIEKKKIIVLNSKQHCDNLGHFPYFKIKVHAFKTAKHWVESPNFECLRSWLPWNFEFTFIFNSVIKEYNFDANPDNCAHDFFVIINIIVAVYLTFPQFMSLIQTHPGKCANVKRGTNTASLTLDPVDPFSPFFPSSPYEKKKSGEISRTCWCLWLNSE